MTLRPLNRFCQSPLVIFLGQYIVDLNEHTLISFAELFEGFIGVVHIDILQTDYKIRLEIFDQKILNSCQINRPRQQNLP